MKVEAMSKNKEPGMGMLVAVLTSISLITALLLGLVNMVTAPQIKINTEKKTAEAMQAVLPAESYEDVTADYTGGDASILAISKAGEEGYVVQVKPATSFSGTLSVMVGVAGDGTCTGISIVETGETSGLGSNAGKPDWQAQFVGKSGTVSVSKDGGDIEALTGATITSRGVCESVTSALAAAASLG